MKQTKKWIAIAITTVVFAACQKDAKFSNPPADPSNALTKESARRGHGDDDHDHESGPGHVYTLSNQASGNKVMDYRRAANGTLTFVASYSTGGNGTGGGLGNQGAVILGDDEEGDMLFAVNAGSNTISSFRITNNGLYLKSTVNSGGMQPVSITQHDHIVFVLNAGGNGNISGFRLGESGRLHPIPNSTRPLSANNAGAAQISFVNDGKVVAITEKATNNILTYTVNEWGIPGAMHTLTSANTTPFGFAVGNDRNIFVSEAAGGAPGASTLSSYRIQNNGTISLADGPVGANQSAACWVVITNNGKYAYTTNTASNNLSTFRINSSSGSIEVLHAISATTGTGPVDAALSNNSKFLYVLNAGSHSISAYSVSNNGGLSNVQTVAGLPTGANGLAAK
jgi:6-phosphogluconolactonase (cycloisomerase 2 family)